MQRTDYEHVNNLKWNLMHNNKRHQPLYPSESVVRFVSGILKNNKKAKILDAGCGAGRHVVMCSELGGIPYGIDSSASGVEHTINLLKNKGMSEYCGNIIKAPVSCIPFDDESFDCCICYAVLYYMVPSDIVKSVSELRRVLKPGGRIMLQIRTIEDYRYIADKAGACGDDQGVIIDEIDGRKSSSEENGMFMHFFKRDEVKNLMKDFLDLDICTEQIYHENDAYADVNFIVTAGKAVF